MLFLLVLNYKIKQNKQKSKCICACNECMNNRNSNKCFELNEIVLI